MATGFFPSPNIPQPQNVQSGSGYPLNPGPTGGVGAFGAVPGAVGLPNPYKDLGGVVPGLPGLNAGASGVIGNELGGILSPQTQMAMQDLEARMAQQSGMPGTNMRAGTLGGNRSARDLGLTIEQLQRQGLQDYNATIPTISRTQTVDPSQQIGLAQWNAINRSAPDPTLAANYSKYLFDQYLAQMRGPGRGTSGGGGPAGGTGYAPTPSAPSGPSAFGSRYGSPTGSGQPYDPLNDVFGTDPTSLGEMGDWWNQPTTPDLISQNSYAPVAGQPPVAPDYTQSDTGYDPLAGFGDLGF